MATDGTARGKTIALGGAVLAIVATFLPWVAVRGPGIAGETFSGTAGGTLAAAVGGVVVGTVLFQDWDPKDRKVTAALGGVLFLHGFVNVIDPSFFVGIGPADPAAGTYLGTIAGAAILGGGLHSLV